jgi:CBS domain-containing protein
MANLDDVEKIAKFGHQVGERTAGEAMQEPATVAADATIVEAFRTMHQRRMSGLYIVDPDGRPTGYLDMLELALRYVDALEAEQAAAHPRGDAPADAPKPPTTD